MALDPRHRRASMVQEGSYDESSFQLVSCFAAVELLFPTG